MIPSYTFSDKTNVDLQTLSFSNIRKVVKYMTDISVLGEILYKLLSYLPNLPQYKIDQADPEERDHKDFYLYGIDKYLLIITKEIYTHWLFLCILHNKIQNKINEFHANLVFVVHLSFSGVSTLLML